MLKQREYFYSVGAVSASTLICFAIYPHLELTNLVMVYLLGTLVVATRGHRGPAAFSAFLSVLCFDFFFVPPRFTFRVADVQYVFTFIVMFIAAMTISHLTIRLREEAEAAKEGERRTAWLMEKAKKAEIEVETERLRSSLLSSVSHDLRTPLAAIMGSASVLSQKVGPEARELAENIESEADRLSRLIQNLLEATRLESRTLQLHKEPYPLEEVVGAALERLEKFLKGREVHVELDEKLPLVPIDPVLVEQVFINLLENGVRHTPIGSRLDITASQQGQEVVVKVADCGPGLTPEDLDHVFDKFYHAKSSPGAGLGLSICRAIVNAHGGRIWAENQKEGGAAFQFTLPLSHER